MELSLDLLEKALPVMGIGYLGIFIVPIVIILVVALLNKFTNKKDSKEETK